MHLRTSKHELEYLPEDVGTYGADSSRVLAEVFETHPRPPGVEATAKLSRYLSLIEDRKHETDEAKHLRIELGQALGGTDPELRRADMRIRRIKALDRK